MRQEFRIKDLRNVHFVRQKFDKIDTLYYDKKGRQDKAQTFCIYKETIMGNQLNDKYSYMQDGQCTYNVTLRHTHETVVVVEKQ